MNAGNDETLRQHIDVAQRLEREGNQLGALVAYRQAFEIAPEGSAIGVKLSQLIAELERTADTSVPRSTDYQTAPSSAAPIQSLPPPIADGLPRDWRPVLPQVSRARLLWSLVAVFASLAVVLLVAMLLFGTLVSGAGDRILEFGGEQARQAVGACLLALLVGLVELWVLRRQVRRGRRLLFVLAATLGGLAGGLVGGQLMASRLMTTSLVGGVIGLVGGLASSLGQAQFMRSHATKPRWIGWSLLTWAIIWTLAWTISWAVGGMLGQGLGAACLLLLTGLAFASFLHWSPEIEF